MPVTVGQRTCSGSRLPRGSVTIAMDESRLSISAGARLILLIWASAAGCIAVGSAALGAWLIGVLELAMLSGVCLAFARVRVSYPVREWLTLEDLVACHRRQRRDGSIEEWLAPRAFIRLDRLGERRGSVLQLRDRGRIRVIGECLTDAERRKVADLLSRALAR